MQKLRVWAKDLSGLIIS